MDFRQLKNASGFTMLELMVTLILIGLISTIVLANTDFLSSRQSDQVQPFGNLVQYLGEESALTKKNIAWFIGNDTQFIASFKNDEWHPHRLPPEMLPSINLSTQFQDNRGNIFRIPDSRVDPFIVFYPSGQSSGGHIIIQQQGQSLNLVVDQYSNINLLNQ
ncbi:prepilin-type N-terminal cleavage/methylation domain-containing protein [Gammaproteobacteria bacterium]|nr:prepilin-type N-terminal cleavage/methylation domain-containing protein [Gammaproteobacteria bacterium]MDA9340583.1 prepilin-type N-terminal cleavage/methylation domain-containing protein [Gammaproteobacteria bacterium]MDA9370603.1 prepilin-type N-terminal cleavage/methylation domain-containing protein [Gammaproteobacteria bacterium]MDC1300163.1 prepilin-type N-terminal cleavage/methylation domain-containing protein [Gammaproteobacteria bacterium]MDC1526228.1 prepilin-type N-terminal cleavag